MSLPGGSDVIVMDGGYYNLFFVCVQSLQHKWSSEMIKLAAPTNWN